MSPIPSTDLLLSLSKPLKSRLGCKTCKSRRVKCGEEKPKCIRCTKTGRKCEYDNKKGLDRFSSAPGLELSNLFDSPLSSTPNTVWRERRAFAYYFQDAAASVGGGLDSTFWRTVVPQVCRSEPAVWDAMICISALFESPDPCPDLISSCRLSRALNQNQQDALDWYARSVSTVRQGIERGSVDTFVGLITCVLFICIESVLGSINEVIRLYGQGAMLIASLREQKAYDKLGLLRETIIPTFVRLGLFSPKSAWPIVQSLIPENFPGNLKSLSLQEFSSLKSARDAIVVLATEIPVLENECEDYLQKSLAWCISDELIYRQKDLHVRLAHWHTAFMNLTKSLRGTKDGLSPTQVSVSALLVTYHEMLLVILSVCVSPLRNTTDAHTQSFQTIIDQATISLNNSIRGNGSLAPYTFEISVGLPLWFTCLRCRDPAIRRTALTLLSRSHQIQGLAKREHGTSLVEKVVALEEAHAMSAMDSALIKRRGTTPIIGSPSYQDMSSPISPYKASQIKFIASPSPPLTEVDNEIGGQYSLFIPQQARIRPHGVFRPRDGFPPEATREDIAHWGRDDDQFYLQFSWNECDQSNETWEMVFGYIPIDIPI
ncbi:hypothetical protein N7478_008919 [Penicillium angulare]|uniref:uncharacterized protein n=1 Tax=Penicillium angulare TaxID=116970 RepID=UPI002540E867|nr:uncharacterized protein N7478_008919 [Penicillium angulare]KAJ5273794.1 hypothetical protein N7478_008919 [Penicillium angulare]